MTWWHSYQSGFTSSWQVFLSFIVSILEDSRLQLLLLQMAVNMLCLWLTVPGNHIEYEHRMRKILTDVYCRNAISSKLISPAPSKSWTADYVTLRDGTRWISNLPLNYIWAWKEFSYILHFNVVLKYILKYTINFFFWSMKKIT